jgi:hypothetical protein
MGSISTGGRATINRPGALPHNATNIMLDPTDSTNPTTPPLTWQRERAQLLHRACTLLEARLQKGDTLHKAVVRVVRLWNGTPLKTDPSRNLALSFSSLIRHFYRWRSIRTPEAFALKFVPGLAPTKPALRDWFARRCVAAGQPVKVVISQVKAEWLAGKRIPGLPVRKGREAFPLHPSSLYRIVDAEQLAVMRSLLRFADEQRARAEAIGRRLILAATRKGGGA